MIAVSQGEFVAFIVGVLVIVGAIATLTMKPPTEELRLAELARAMPRIREQIHTRTLRNAQWAVMPTRTKALYIGGAILFIGWPIWGLAFLVPYFVHLP
jgi:hypothetical protein